MSGRTEKYQAREIELRMYEIMYEADECRRWMIELARRAETTVRRAEGNSLLPKDYVSTMNKTMKVLKVGSKALEPVSDWTAKHD